MNGRATDGRGVAWQCRAWLPQGAVWHGQVRLGGERLGRARQGWAYGNDENNPRVVTNLGVVSFLEFKCGFNWANQLMFMLLAVHVHG